jgi:hypothetical protein
MAAQLIFLSLLLIQSLVMSATFIALYDIVKTTFRLDGLLAFCGTIFVLNMIGYLAFWLAYVDYAVFGFVKIIVMILLLFRFAFAVYLRRLSAHLSFVGEPLVYVFLFFSAVVTLGFCNGGLSAENPIVTGHGFDPSMWPSTTSTATIRFGPPNLGMDNIIPLVFAEALKLGHIASPLYLDWLSSDRPPLQTGLYLALAIQTGSNGYQIVASWLQATFLFGAWAIASAAMLPTTTRRLVVLACCILPPTILNTFFTWPKLLSLGDLLLVFALLFCYSLKEEREHWVIGVAIGGLAAFAILSHGGGAFVLISISIIVLFAWHWPAGKTTIYAIQTFIALYAPWLAYQMFIDPPGNRLLKWHLAGVTKVDSLSLLESVRHSYGTLSWTGYLQGRLANFKVLVDDWPLHLRELLTVVFDHDLNISRNIRHADFFFLLPSLHVIAFAIIAALTLCPFAAAKWSRQRKIALYLFAVSFCTSFVYCILLFTPGSAINHQGSYAVQVMATIAAFMVLSLRVPALAVGLIALQTITVAIVYGFTLPHDPRFLPMQVACLAATTSLFLYSFSPMLQHGTGCYKGGKVVQE